MTLAEAKKYFGEEVFLAICESKVLDGNTCSMNSEGKMVMYECDLANAYKMALTGKLTFFD